MLHVGRGRKGQQKLGFQKDMEGKIIVLDKRFDSRGKEARWNLVSLKAELRELKMGKPLYQD